MSTETLAAAFATARGVLSNVTADQLDDPTPCASWDVRRVVNHLVGGAHWFEITTNAGASPEADDTEDTDYTTGDIVAAYDTASAGALAAFGADGALERMITLPFGNANEEPVFVLPRARVVHAERIGREGATIRAFVEGEGGGVRLKALLFRARDGELADALLRRDGLALNLAGHLRAEEWNGKVSVGFFISDAAPA